MNNYKELIKQVNDIYYISLNDVLKNKDQDRFIEEEIKILNDSNILVIGLYDYVDKHFKSINENLKLMEDKNFKISYQDLLFKIYSSNRDIKIRNELINLNLNLILYMINKLKLGCHVNKEEVFCYGYDGLIKAVENYDIKRNISFSSYACICIKSYLINYMNDRYNLPKLFEAKFIKEKKKSHEEIYSYDERIDFYEDLIDKISNKSEFWKNMRKRRINMAFPMDYDELDEEYYLDFDMDLEIDYKIFEEKLKCFLAKLPINNAIIANLYFNLNDKNMNVDEISKLFQISKRKLYYIINSLKKYSSTNVGMKLLEVSYPSLFHEEEREIIKRK